jgi:hypothetical protein
VAPDLAERSRMARIERAGRGDSPGSGDGRALDHRHDAR